MNAREAVIDAAMLLFAKSGYAGTSTRSIARMAGVNEVTVFRQFGSKAGLLRAIADRIRKETAGEASLSELDAVDTHEVLRRLALREVRSGIRYGGLAMRLSFDAVSVPEVREVMGDAVPANLQALAEFMASRQERGALRRDVAPETIAESFFAMTSSFVMYRGFLAHNAGLSDVDIERPVDELLDLFWSGVRYRES